MGGVFQSSEKTGGPPGASSRGSYHQEDPSSVQGPLYNPLEDRYEGLRGPRKVVRYISCFIVFIQLGASLVCFCAAPWAQRKAQEEKLKIAGGALLLTSACCCLLVALVGCAAAWIVSHLNPKP